MVREKLFALTELLADAAQGLRRDAEVRGNLVKWNSLEEIGIRLQEADVPFFCGGTDEIRNPQERGFIFFLKDASVVTPP